MIEEFVREMTAEERADLERAMRWRPADAPPSTTQGMAWEAAGLALVLVLALAGIWLAGGRNRGGLAFAALAGAVVVVHHVVSGTRKARRGEYSGAGYLERRRGEIALVLEDGRATVTRVRAVAVAQIEPIEDEGTG